MSNISEAFDKAYPKHELIARAKLLKLDWATLEGMLWGSFIKGWNTAIEEKEERSYERSDRPA